jgi:hypothetical protein
MLCFEKQQTTFLKEQLMRQNVLFTAINETIQVNHIIYAGPVSETPVASRKNDLTHYFKIITRTGAIWCHFKNAEAANKARGTLAVMMDQVKKVLFKTLGEVVDPKEIISYSNVQEFKSSNENSDFGFVVNINCIDERYRKLWFVYSSNEYAEKGRKALYACMMESNGVNKEPSTVTAQPSEVKTDSVLCYN